MASSTSNVKMGACSINFDGVDLGYTKGGVNIEVNTTTFKVTVDQFGDSEINEYIMGRSIKVTTQMAETALDVLSTLMPGGTLFGGARATGFVSFTGQPTANDTITINGTVFTYKASGAVGAQINIGATLAQTLLNTATVLNTSTDTNVLPGSYKADTTNSKVLVTYDTFGTVGNSFTLAKSGTNIAVSAATLSGGTGNSAQRVEVTNAQGIDLLSIAKPLVLHPVALSSVTRNEDLVIPLAATSGNITFAYKYNEQRVYNVEFMGYPDSNTKLLFYFGDPTAS